MSTASALQTTAVKATAFTNSARAELQVHRKCACGSPKTSLTGKCEECNSKKIQRKLNIGASNDPLEREADRVADQVLSTHLHSAFTSTPPNIQRFTGQTTGEVVTAPASVDRVLAASGRPLEPALQKEMSQRFGHDFSKVRVHTGTSAEQSAREVHAQAYTVGHNIVFDAGHFAPGSQEGRRLLAHELTHVVQQNSSGKSVQRQTVTPGTSRGGSGSTGCTPNPHGSALPPVGTAHRPPAHMLPCLLTQAQVRASSDWCLDSWQHHRGETCYRRIPGSYCAMSDQYCFTENGCCHSSPDTTSPVDPGSPGAGSTCTTAWRCIPGHVWDDVI